MSKETLKLQPKKHLNSRVNDRPFYKKKYIDEENPILAQADYVKGRHYFIVEGVEARYLENSDPYALNIEEELFSEYIQRVELLRKIELDQAVYKPQIFDEKIALECGLIPFCYIKHIYEERESIVKLLALLGKFDELKPRLDSYQLLSHGTIDEQSLFFYDKEAFEKVMGGDIVAKMEKKLEDAICHGTDSD